MASWSGVPLVTRRGTVNAPAAARLGTTRARKYHTPTAGTGYLTVATPVVEEVAAETVVQVRGAVRR
jgi:hypothetical protein